MEWGVDHAALSRPNLVALAIKSRAFPFPHPIDPRRGEGVSAVITGETDASSALLLGAHTHTHCQLSPDESIFSRGLSG